MGCGASSAEQAEVAGEKKNAELVRQMGASGDKDEVDQVDLFDARDAWRVSTATYVRCCTEWIGNCLTAG